MPPLPNNNNEYKLHTVSLKLPKLLREPTSESLNKLEEANPGFFLKYNCETNELETETGTCTKIEKLTCSRFFDRFKSDFRPIRFELERVE
jgi:hypothetical protein